ncbi:hypothetical protein BpHYR1_023559 [Brachionus plicatilis]|uniref:Uncharacterized protein n=1 Tax=Brachionus plicatilis TaxID=10195 RepID=A0A3M7PYI1_BRAPC|nr:hypothetical protein BpHYR1_023559 [Brachionus plicatilis]
MKTACTLFTRFNGHAIASLTSNSKAKNQVRKQAKNFRQELDLLLTTYKALIRPIIEYIPFIKYSASDARMMSLEKQQRKAERRRRGDLIQCYKIINGIEQLNLIGDCFKDNLNTGELRSTSDRTSIIRESKDSSNSTSIQLLHNPGSNSVEKIEIGSTHEE